MHYKVCVAFTPKSKKASTLSTGNACFNNPAGVADNNIISNSQITASGYRSSGALYQPKRGRLNNVSNGKGWCAQSCCGTQDWLQIDLGTTRQICGVATQGDNQNDSWVITFKLSFSTDEGGWTFYKNADNTEKVNIHSLLCHKCT